jgi:hypothetical protein
MYALVWYDGHDVWKEWWYAFTSEVSLQANLYMIHEDQVFVANVVVMNSTWETMVMSVISQLACVMWNFSSIVKIHK